MELLSIFSELENTSLFGIPLINTDSFCELIVRFIFNIAVSFVIVGLFYYRKSKRRDYFYTFMLISTTVFLLIFLLGHEKLQMGLALGLFAIFGIVRYRTETVPIREMTYLFMTIGVSVINGLATSVSHIELVATNAVFILMTWIMESRFVDTPNCKFIVYEKIHLITPEHHEEMMEDLKKRTGLNIVKFEIGYINFLKDTCFVKVYYNTDDDSVNTIDQITKTKQFNG
ncbi:MAG: DUF4956 domain-containing protein [Paludibacteraceae bacterium]|nr:DUF4956 domain-containing protein [Paludibacteraceae bacterium]